MGGGGRGLTAPSPEGKLSCCETDGCNSAASFQEQTKVKGFRNKCAELFDGNFSISAFELGTQAPGAEIRAYQI